MWYLVFLLVALSHADVPYEMAYCFETQDCGINSIGSYLMEHVLSDNRTLSGHLFQIKNGLPFDVTFYWDVLGVLSEGPRHKKAIKVKSGSSRYFDSKVHTTHTVRLFIKNVDVPSEDNSTQYQFEAMDKVTGKEERKCANGRKNKVCDFLFRLCYQNKFEDANQCDEYEQACSEFETKTDEEECIESCALTHYSHLLEGAEKVSFKFDRYAIVKAIIDQEHGKETSVKWKAMMNAKTEQIPEDWLVKVAEIKASDDAVLQSSNTTIAVLITIMVILVVFFVCGIWYWNRNYMRGLKDENVPVNKANFM